MSQVSFQTLPDHSRLWCFGASRAPGGAETAHLLDTMSDFVKEWTAHSQDLRAGMLWRDQRFLLIAVDEAHTGASGCSIDTLNRQLKDLESKLNLDLLDSTRVWYRDPAGQVRSCSRADFRLMVEGGEVDAATPVFDLTVARVGDYRKGRFEVAARDSWHRSLLGTT